MKKNKMYSTVAPAEDLNHMTIKVNDSKIPNKMHLDAQIRFPARVHEDKRFKQPRYKNKMFEDQ